MKGSIVRTLACVQTWHAFTVKLMAEMGRLPTVPCKIQQSCPVSGAFTALRGRASKLTPDPLPTVRTLSTAVSVGFPSPHCY